MFIVVVQMLVLRSDWQAALPTLTQLGNGLALIICLDCMLGHQADTAFMLLAPMLGITLGIGNRMQCLVSNSHTLQLLISPLVISPHVMSPHVGGPFCMCDVTSYSTTGDQTTQVYCISVYRL